MTCVPGWADSNCLPMVLNDSVNDAAAKTLMSPLMLGAEEPVEVGAAAGVLEPQAAAKTRTAAAARAVAARRSGFVMKCSFGAGNKDSAIVASQMRAVKGS